MTKWLALLILLPCVVLGHGKTILVSGDSISGSGEWGYAVWPELVATLSGAELVNEAYPGFTVAQMLSAYEPGPKRFDYCLFMGGVNDFREGSALETTSEAADSLLIKLSLSRCKPLILRPSPCGSASSWDAEKEAHIEAYWLHLKQRWCDSGLASCLDTWRLLGDRGDASKLSREFDSGDGLHPNASGENTIGFMVFQLLFTK